MRGEANPSYLLIEEVLCYSCSDTHRCFSAEEMVFMFDARYSWFLNLCRRKDQRRDTREHDGNIASVLTVRFKIYKGLTNKTLLNVLQML